MKKGKLQKKFFGILLTIALILTSIVPAFATPGDYVDAGNQVVYDSVSDLIDDLKSGDASIEDIYRENDNSEYINVSDAYQAQVAALVAYLVAEDADTDEEIQELLLDATKLAEVTEAMTEAAAAVAADPNVDPNQWGQQDELEVISVSAINATTIKVTFADAVDAVTNANFTVSKGTLQSAVLSADKKVTTLTLGGLNYGDTLSVTVSGVKYGNGASTVADYTNAAVKVPTIDELYSLIVTSDATNNTIKSDGASMTMITATLKEKATGNVVLQDAQIQFTTTLGSLSQPQVALQAGTASTQLRSISSATSVTAVVQATVASAPGATQYVGLSGNLLVSFTPDGSGSNPVTMVSPVSAGSDQGDRFYVQFSGNIDAAAYKAVVTAAGWTGVPYGVQYRGAAAALKNLNISDVYNLTPNTLMFVLDTDVAGSVAPALGDAAATDVEMMSPAFTHTTATHNFLKDNINHVINFPANITGLVTNSSDITFMMSDVTKPFIYGVDATDNMNLVVRASEPLAENLVETTADAAGGARALTQINSHFTIDGKVVRLDSTPTPANVAAALAANEIIVTELKVGKYTNSTDDTRNKVFIKLYKDFKLASGAHGIQIAGIGDWAGNTDNPANIVTTQTFAFTVAADTNVPVPTVVAQSPEQFLITFDRNVETITGKNIADAIKIYTKEGYTATPKVPLAMNVNSGANDYVITPVDVDGVAIAAVGNTGAGSRFATTDTINGCSRFLVEFNRDWSVKQSGQDTTKDNYWKSGLNPYQFVFNSLTSTTGVAIGADTTCAVTLAYDGTSPTIAVAQDLFEKSPNVAFRGQTATASGQLVYVQMSEPVQLVGGNPVAAISNPITPNLIQDPTPAAYNVITGISVPTFRFISNANPDNVVQGTVVGGTLAEDDKSYVVAPATALTAGTWTLYIEQISDDHGNTAATINKQVTVPQGAAVVTDTKVAWAAFDNAKATYDYLYVKYTKVMQAYTANGVDATTNYKFRGYDLPQGSQVFRGIEGITDDWDGVTIRMPNTAWDGLAGPDFSTNMSVASNFKAADNEALSAPYQFEITNVLGGSVADKDGLAAGLFEALYVNSDASGIAKGTTTGTAAILNATASEVATIDGKIDTVTLTLSNTITTNGTEKVYINGKEFVNSTNGAGATQVYTAIPANEVTGTATTALKLTSASDAIMVNTGKVTDAAAPVLIFNYTAWAAANPGAASAKTFVLQSSEALQANAGAAVAAIGATATIATSTPVAWNADPVQFGLTAITAGDTTVTLTTDAAADNTSATGYTALILGTTDGNARILDAAGNAAVVNITIQ